MISAGNDIVALKAIDRLRTILPAFYSKFITPLELDLYNKAEISFENFIWLLWSVKESAYKYLKRGEGDLVFSPSKITIQQIEVSRLVDPDKFRTDQPIDVFYRGTLLFNSNKLYFKSAVNDEFIATIVNNDLNFEQIYWGIKLIDAPDYKTQSHAVRLFVLAELNNLITSDDLWIDKHPVGYPVLLHDSRQVNIPISFAHHDRYVSYSFQIPK